MYSMYKDFNYLFTITITNTIVYNIINMFKLIILKIQFLNNQIMIFCKNVMLSKCQIPKTRVCRNNYKSQKCSFIRIYRYFKVIYNFSVIRNLQFFCNFLHVCVFIFIKICFWNKIILMFWFKNICYLFCFN